MESPLIFLKMGTHGLLVLENQRELGLYIFSLSLSSRGERERKE